MAHVRATDDRGFTLVEVMVAMTLLLVGVLGTVTMIDGANSATSTTKGREAGTALARSVLEIARAVPYRDLTAARILAELELRPGLADSDSTASGHQVSSRNFVFTVTPTICSMDDPKDDLGDHDEPAVTFCPETDALASGASGRDRNPDDYRRIGVTLDWMSGPRSERLTQRGLIANPVGGLGPSIASFAPDTPNTTAITNPTTQSPSYKVTTSTAADAVSWSVDGARLGEATGADNSWSFNWDIGDVEAPEFPDCTYVLQAEAFDEKGRAGTPSALTVTLNRRQPFAPANFAGGRNLNGADVDLQWARNPECDVKQYLVYRGTDPGTIEDVACTVAATARPQCIDEEAPSGVTLYYQVVAVDTKPDGSDRPGDRSATLVVGGEAVNLPAPTAPPTVSICLGGMPDCNDIDGNAAPSGSPVLSWDPSTDPDGIQFYRVYRGENTYEKRLDVLFPVVGKPLVFIDDTASTSSEQYWVSAVDALFGESTLTGPVQIP